MIDVGARAGLMAVFLELSEELRFSRFQVLEQEKL